MPPPTVEAFFYGKIRKSRDCFNVSYNALRNAKIRDGAQNGIDALRGVFR